MSKFKVGDRVKVKGRKGMYFDTAGKVGTIINISNGIGSYDLYDLRIDGNTYTNHHYTANILKLDPSYLNELEIKRLLGVKE